MFTTDAIDMLVGVSLYMTMWLLGGATAMSGAAWVLHRRGTLNWVTVGGLALVALTFLYGAKVQHGLVYKPVLEALMVSPAELLHPGRRLPLALMMSLSVGLLWCLTFRVNWRDMGDALAFAAPVFQGIGRAGCLLSGCCTGTVCHLPWAVTYGPVSDAFMLHNSMGWIPEGAIQSLPVHPLPAYYMIFHALLAGVLLRMLLQRRPPGSLLLVALMVGPPVRFALEQLRGGLPWRDWDRYLVTVEIWIAIDLAIAAYLLVRHYRRKSRDVGGTAQPSGVFSR